MTSFLPFVFYFSDLALRNCYLTADLTVKVGDYGIGPYRYKVSRKLSNYCPSNSLSDGEGLSFFGKYLHDDILE